MSLKNFVFRGGTKSGTLPSGKLNEYCTSEDLNSIASSLNIIIDNVNTLLDKDYVDIPYIITDTISNVNFSAIPTVLAVSSFVDSKLANIEYPSASLDGNYYTKRRYW